ncbi:hypothetical protein Scep_018826 [Stephania cephalantha]|uniref:Uncharacterized protein n=1 Tax=Stephania cephalantha TaxID=152367 RepID=A0AAP0NKM3_9MAGN
MNGAVARCRPIESVTSTSSTTRWIQMVLKAVECPGTPCYCPKLLQKRPQGSNAQGLEYQRPSVFWLGSQVQMKRESPVWALRPFLKESFKESNKMSKALSFDTPEVSQSPSVEEWFHNFNQLVEDSKTTTPQHLLSSFTDSTLSPEEQIALYKSLDEKP